MATGDKWTPRLDRHLDNDISEHFLQVDGPCDLRIVLVGATGTGKSATGNTLIGGEKKVFESTAIRQSVTRGCSVAETERFGNKLVVVDTPGIFDNTMSEEEWKIQLMECTYLACPGVHAFLFLMKIGQRDIGNEDTKTFHMIKNLLGEEFLSHTIVVFTGKEILDVVDDDFESYLSKLPEESKSFIKLCKGGTVAVTNTSGGKAEMKKSAKQIVDKVEQLVEQNGGRSNFYKNALFDEKNKAINKRMEQILNENHEIQNKINLFNEKLESLKGDIKDGKPKEQSKEQQTLEKQIDDLKKALVDRTNLRLVASDKIKYERRKEILVNAAKVAAGLSVFAGVVAAVRPKTVIAGVVAAATPK